MGLISIEIFDFQLVHLKYLKFSSVYSKIYSSVKKYATIIFKILRYRLYKLRVATLEMDQNL